MAKQPISGVPLRGEESFAMRNRGRRFALPRLLWLRPSAWRKVRDIFPLCTLLPVTYKGDRFKLFNL